MNSQSDLTIDLLFTIVAANAFNDPPARSHPQQGAKEAPGLWGILWVTPVVSNEHPYPLLLADAGGKKAEL